MIETILGLAEEVFKSSNLKKLREPYETMRSLRLQLLEELNRGQESDDAKVEYLEAQIKIQADAMLILLASGGGNS